MEFALGMSIPDSIIVVHTRTSISPPANLSIAFSSSFGGICPCATKTLHSGTNCFISCAIWSMLCTRLWTKKTWPFRSISLRIASLINCSLNSATKVLTGVLYSGALSMMLMSRIPDSAKLSVLGIGVAVKVKTSTSERNFFSFSLWATPNLCSSSIITKPRFLNFTSSWMILCVPIQISIWPACSFVKIVFWSEGDLNRLIISTDIGYGLNLSLKVL